jgi:DNA-binding GntR family transcriptional regulator
VAELQRILAHMEEAIREGDLIGLVETDVAFHGLVMSRSGQPHTTQIWGTIAPRMRAYFYTHLRDVMPAQELLDRIPGDHRALFDALVARDRERVAALLLKHVRDLPGLTRPTAGP